jgi:hypothetical protein
LLKLVWPKRPYNFIVYIYNDLILWDFIYFNKNMVHPSYQPHCQLERPFRQPFWPQFYTSSSAFSKMYKHHVEIKKETNQCCTQTLLQKIRKWKNYVIKILLIHLKPNCIQLLLHIIYVCHLFKIDIF